MDQKDDSIKKIFFQFVILMIITVVTLVLLTPMVEHLDAQLQMTRQLGVGEWVGGP